MFLNIHIAFSKAQNQIIPKNSLILYHLHALDHLEDLKLCINDFGYKNTKILLATRHPLQGLNSVYKWMADLIFPSFIQPHTFFQYQKSIYSELSIIDQLFPKVDKKIILLHQQISSNMKLMKSLCAYLNIDWNNSMTKPTILGKLWWGNANKPKKGIEGKIFKEFSPEGYFEKKDWKILWFLFPSRYCAYGFYSNENRISVLMFIFLSLLPTNNELKILYRGYKGLFIKKSKKNSYLINKKLGSMSPFKIRLCEWFLIYFWLKIYFKRIIILYMVFFKRKKYDSSNRDLLLDLQIKNLT